MEYKDLLRDAKANGVASEKTMWQSVDSLSDMLCVLKEEHPEMYWRFIREQHGIMYNNHYDRNFAEMDENAMVRIGHLSKLSWLQNPFRFQPIQPSGINM